ncbi:hypothetical protein PISMIDRAFT_682347 [Pisolithus microcarpus 441]|uniref:Uncharacterized protein n=1 Tax=Pisolithus microcarpus 441 TaxID=765257 RepID=A0A0C9Y6W2_9AGAM|nr:hypothetical protein PISMIDRAFT_682347 [Pisolithus microcarpus 441]
MYPSILFVFGRDFGWHAVYFPLLLKRRRTCRDKVETYLRTAAMPVIGVYVCL